MQNRSKVFSQIKIGIHAEYIQSVLANKDWDTFRRDLSPMKTSVLVPRGIINLMHVSPQT